MSGRRNLMIAKAVEGFPVTDTVFDVEPDSDNLTFEFCLSGHSVVDFGDGTTYTQTVPLKTSGDTMDVATYGVQHTYAAPGTYTVIISPLDNTGFWCTMNASTDAYKLTTVLRQIGTMQKRVNNMFYNAHKLREFAKGVHIPDGITAINQFIGGNVALNIPLFTKFNDDFTIPDSVTNLSAGFGNYGPSNLVELPDSFKLPSKLVDGFYCFYNCSGLKKIPADFKIPKTCKNLQRFFMNCRKLEFDISNLFPEEWADGGYTCDLSNFAWNVSGLTGTLPQFVYDGRNNFTHNTESFGACTKLTNYNDIPASWGGGGA